MNHKRPHNYEQDIARFRLALEQHGDNPAAHAALADIHWRAEELEPAIHHWRMAISGSPHAPMAAGWKSKLRRALEVQDRRARGLKGSDFDDFKVCHRCQADIPVKARTCPECNRAVEMTFFEWCAQRENIEDVARTAAPFVLVLSIMVLVLAHMSLEVKACVAMATVMVAAWYFLRGIGGTTTD